MVLLVRIDEQDDIFLPGNYDGPNDGTDLEIGLPVLVGFEEIKGDQGKAATLLRWRLDK